VSNGKEPLWPQNSRCRWAAEQEKFQSIIITERGGLIGGMEGGYKHYAVGRSLSNRQGLDD
jgi:hypothetical protein